MRIPQRFVSALGIGAVIAGVAVGTAVPSAAATAAPKLTSTSPKNGGYAEPKNSAGTPITVSATYDSALDSSSKLKIFTPSGLQVGGSSSVNSGPFSSGTTITFTPQGPWPNGPLTYTAQAHAVSSDKTATHDDTFTFTIEAVTLTVDQPTGPITQKNQQSFPVSGKAEPGASVQITAYNDVPGGASSATRTATAQTTATASGGYSAVINVSNLSDGSGTGTPGSPGGIDFDVKQTDAAGNTFGPVTTAHPVQKHATPPPTPSVGSQPDIDQSNEDSYTVSGTISSQPASVVAMVRSDQSNGACGTTGVVCGTTTTFTSNGNPVTPSYSWSVTVNVSAVPLGNVNITAHAFDSFGNVSPNSAAVTVAKGGFVIVAQGPAANTRVFPPSAISDTFNSAYTLSKQNNNLTGQKASTITVKNSSGVTAACGTQYSGDHTIFCDPSQSLPLGVYNVSVDAYDTKSPQDNTKANYSFTVGATGVSLTSPTSGTPITASNQQAFPVSGTGLAGVPVQLSASSSGGGRTITGTVTPGGDGHWTSTLDVSSLPDGTVTFTASQTDSNDTTKSAHASTHKQTLPGAPTGVIGWRGDRYAVVQWSAPKDLGGGALKAYTVTSHPGDLHITVAAPTRTAVFSGLTNGRGYRFTVTATTNGGTSRPSAGSNRVVPAATETISAVVGKHNRVYVFRSLHSSPRSLGGSSLDAPAVATTATGRTFVIASRADGHLWVRSLTTKWSRLSRTKCAAPAAVAYTNTLYVACRSHAGHLLVGSAAVPASRNPSVRSLHSLGGTLSAGPAVAIVNGVATYYVTGRGGHLLMRTKARGFHRTTSLVCTGRPAVAAVPSTTVIACQNRHGHRLAGRVTTGGRTTSFARAHRLSGGPGIALTADGFTAFAFAQLGGNALDRAEVVGSRHTGWSYVGGRHTVHGGAQATQLAG